MAFCGPPEGELCSKGTTARFLRPAETAHEAGYIFQNPVFMGALRRANNMAMALEARGFGLSITPTSFIEYRLERRDIIALAALIAMGTAYFIVYYTGYAAIGAG